jgi:hypothetical protein
MKNHVPVLLDAPARGISEEPNSSVPVRRCGIKRGPLLKVAIILSEAAHSYYDDDINIMALDRFLEHSFHKKFHYVFIIFSESSYYRGCPHSDLHVFGHKLL